MEKTALPHAWPWPLVKAQLAVYPSGYPHGGHSEACSPRALGGPLPAVTPCASSPSWSHRLSLLYFLGHFPRTCLHPSPCLRSALGNHADTRHIVTAQQMFAVLSVFPRELVSLKPQMSCFTLSILQSPGQPREVLLITLV